MFVKSMLICWIAVLSVSADGELEPTATTTTAPASRTASSSAEIAADLFEQAMQREVEGDLHGRNALLQRIVAVQPDYGPALWTLGQVRFRGGWLSPEAVAREVSADPVLAKYREARARFADSAGDHFTLAAWCRRHDLQAERQAHLLAAATLQPRNARFQRALGRSQYQARWMSDEEIAEQKRLDEQAVSAYATWKPKLHQLRRQLKSGFSEQRASAQESMRTIRDPLAITALEEIFSTHSEEMGRLAVETLSRMPHQESTLSLVRHAVWSEWSGVRDAAVAQLRYRDSRHYVPALIDHLRPTRSGEAWLRLGDGRPVQVWF